MAKKVARKQQGYTHKAGHFWAPQRGEMVRIWLVAKWVWVPAWFGFTLVMGICIVMLVIAFNVH